MITFICCSIKPDQAEALQLNIAKTVNIPFEFIAFDNRVVNYGICKVYNICAKKSKYDYLCFLHEDIQFNNQKWGEIIITKLREDNCGVIGFAGSQIKVSMPSGWPNGADSRRMNLIQHRKGSSNIKVYQKNPDNVDFSEVITLDGLCLFVCKTIWEEYKFDEKLLTGFHGYDIDFSLSVAQKFKNYVCNTISIEHFSLGSLSADWVKAIVLCNEKWSDKLPMYTSNLTKYDLEKEIAKAEYEIIKNAIKNKYPLFDDCHTEMYNFIKRNKKKRIAWKLFFKYLTYKI